MFPVWPVTCLEDLLFAYYNSHADDELRCSKSPAMLKRVRLVASVCIHFCVGIRQTQVLFSDIYAKFKACGMVAAVKAN